MHPPSWEAPLPWRLCLDCRELPEPWGTRVPAVGVLPVRRGTCSRETPREGFLGGLGVPSRPSPQPDRCPLAGWSLPACLCSLARRERRVSQADSGRVAPTLPMRAGWGREAEVTLALLLARVGGALLSLRYWAVGCGAWQRKVIPFFFSLSAFRPAFARALMTVTQGVRNFLSQLQLTPQGGKSS